MRLQMSIVQSINSSRRLPFYLKEPTCFNKLLELLDPTAQQMLLEKTYVGKRMIEGVCVDRKLLLDKLAETSLLGVSALRVGTYMAAEMFYLIARTYLWTDNPDLFNVPDWRQCAYIHIRRLCGIEPTQFVVNSRAQRYIFDGVQFFNGCYRVARNVYIMRPSDVVKEASPECIRKIKLRMLETGIRNKAID